MTHQDLATDHLKRSVGRLKILIILKQDGMYADCIRECQETVELALKGILRSIQVDPPHWHDVGTILIAEQSKLPAPIALDLPRIAKLSLELRKERENAFYGQEDLIPSSSYSEQDAEGFLSEVKWLLDLIQKVYPHVIR